MYKDFVAVNWWIADCKSYKMKKTLFRMLYYLYCDQNSVPENELATLMNIKNSFLSEDLQIRDSNSTTFLEQDKSLFIENCADKVSNGQLSHENESLCTHIRQSKQTKKKVEEFPESIRYKIQYYDKLCSVNDAKVNINKKSTSISNLPDEQFRITCPPPVVVGMILKSNVDECQSAIKSQESVEKHNYTVTEINELTMNYENSCSFSKFNCSILSNKDKGNERFLINLFEPKLTKQYSRDKKLSNNSLISMTSKLFIKDFSMEYTGTSEDTVQNYTESADNTSLDIMKRIYKQRQTIRQAAKAVQTCKKSNYFYNSPQRAEAERILLTASLKRDHFLVQLQNSQHQELPKNTADLTISNIKFSLNVDEIDNKRQIWFLVTCATESTFHISSMLELPTKNSYLQLPEMYTFENVPPDFKIKLCVYELKIGESNHRKKLKLEKKLKRKFHSLTSNSSLDENVLSSFKVCSWVDLTLDNFKNNVLNLNKTETSLLSVVNFSGSAFSLVLNQKHSGFITVGFEVNDYIIWDQNWCTLLNSILYFWNHPSEECLNESKNFIDLRNCVIGCTKNMCVRRNTLVLESTKVISKRYYLSCDSVEDFDTWNNYIKSILDTFLHWKSLMYV